jgi:hypothetical protein
MNRDVVYTWLDLPPGSWPPTYYQLLGLEPGPVETERVEQLVHQRLESVRRYQLTHPEQATEVMNRLAQAFVCLTDPEAKKAYDASLAGEESDAAAPVAVAVREEPPDDLDWLDGPWEKLTERLGSPSTETAYDRPLPTAVEQRPLSDTQVPGLLPERASPSGDETATPLPAAFGANTLDFPAAGGPVRLDREPEPEPPPSSRRRSLVTKRALYHRVSRTRRLLWAWAQVGQYLGQPTRKLTRPAEATELIERMTEIRDLLREFPPLLGEAGQPGYSVVALARQKLIVPTFQTLLLSQRETLARDWRNGLELLTEHRRFLRDELLVMRRRGPWRWAVRGARIFLNEHPGGVLLLLGLTALGVVIWKSLVFAY